MCSEPCGATSPAPPSVISYANRGLQEACVTHPRPPAARGLSVACLILLTGQRLQGPIWGVLGQVGGVTHFERQPKC